MQTVFRFNKARWDGNVQTVQTAYVPSDRTAQAVVYIGGHRWEVTRNDIAQEIRFWTSEPDGYTVTREAQS